MFRVNKMKNKKSQLPIFYETAHAEMASALEMLNRINEDVKRLICEFEIWILITKVNYIFNLQDKFIYLNKFKFILEIKNIEK